MMLVGHTPRQAHQQSLNREGCPACIIPQVGAWAVGPAQVRSPMALATVTVAKVGAPAGGTGNGFSFRTMVHRSISP